MVNALLFVAWVVTFPSSSDVKFIGSTPCGRVARQFVAIPPAAECERISWQLTLPASGKGTYSLTAVYGMQANGVPGFVNGGTSVRLYGTTTTIVGNGRRYRIAASDRSLEFVQLDPNLIHLAGEDGSLMVGNPGWSYTLSRTPAIPSEATIDFRPNDGLTAALGGVFEGRTPCEALENDLGRKRNRECTKVKWRLTFSGEKYVLEGFGYRNPPRTGTWRALGDSREPETIVVELDPGQQPPFLRFRFVDNRLLIFLDRHGKPLVGDEYQSYTLNKIR